MTLNFWELSEKIDRDLSQKSTRESVEQAREKWVKECKHIHKSSQDYPRLGELDRIWPQAFASTLYSYLESRYRLALEDVDIMERPGA